MHLTLKFLGDIEEDEAAKLTEVLREIPLAPMRPRIRGVTAFPSPSRARVIVVALADPNVDALAAEVERRSGFPREERPFRAHVTLARIRQPVNAHRWLERATIEGETQVTALVLYESKQGAYRPISRFPAPTS
jgi:2'-5' RNA ligase